MTSRKLPNFASLLVLSIALAALVGACSAAGNRASGAGASGTGAAASSGQAGGPSSGQGGMGGSTSTVHFGPDAGDSGPPPPPSTGCDATSCQAAGGQCMNMTCVIHENPGQVPSGTVTALQRGRERGRVVRLPLPVRQDGLPPRAPPADAAVRGDGARRDLRARHLPGHRLPGLLRRLEPGARRLLAGGVGRDRPRLRRLPDRVKVEVTKTSGGEVAGPISEGWTIATGSLKGTIYYETYGSAILGGLGSVGIMEIQPGAATPTIVKNGVRQRLPHRERRRLHAGRQRGQPRSSRERELRPQEQREHHRQPRPTSDFTYGGIYPDGSFVDVGDGLPHLARHARRASTTPRPAPTSPRRAGTRVITNGARRPSRPTGRRSPSTTRTTGRRAHARDDGLRPRAQDVLQPGRHRERPAATRSAGRRSRPTPSGSSTTRAQQRAFETDGGAWATSTAPTCATKTVARLDALDGYRRRQGVPAGERPDLNFAPTVLPEAVGGYFWVVFTSHRSYGNTLPSMDNGGPERQALGRGVRHQRHARARTRATPPSTSTGRSRGRQPARLLGAHPCRPTATTAPRATSAAAASAAQSTAARSSACRPRAGARTSTRRARRPPTAATPATSASTRAARSPPRTERWGAKWPHTGGRHDGGPRWGRWRVNMHRPRRRAPRYARVRNAPAVNSFRPTIVNVDSHGRRVRTRIPMACPAAADLARGVI